MISIGDAVLKVGVDKKAFDRDMKGLSGAINKHKKAIGLAMVGMGVAAVAAVAASIKAFADMGDEVQKMALRTGFSTEALSELRHVADISGTSLTSLEKGVKKMSKTIVDADEGMATYIRSFDRIGLSAEELMKLSPEEQFEKITLAIAELESPTLRAATATDIFGRAGTQLLPMLDAGSEGIAELRQEAHDLGIVFDQEAANRAAELKDSLTRLKGAITGVKFTLAQEMLPSVEAAIPLLEQWAKALGPIIENTLNWNAAEDKRLKQERAWRTVRHQQFLWLNRQNNQYEESVDLLENILRNQGLLTAETQRMIKGLKEVIQARKDEERALEDLSEASAKTTDEMIDDIRDLTREAIDTAKRRAKAATDAIDDRMRAERDAHQERMDILQDEYDATIKTIDAELSRTLEGYRDRVDLINDQLEAIEDAEQHRRDTERRAEIEAQIATEDDAEQRGDLETELDELILKSSSGAWKKERKLAYEARIAEEKDADERRRLRRRLSAFLVELEADYNRKLLENRREALYEQIDIAREEARTAKDLARDEYETKIDLQDKALENFITNLEAERDAWDAALERKLEQYDTDLEAFEKLLEQELDATEVFVSSYNTLLGQLKDKTVTITTVRRTITEAVTAPVARTPAERWRGTLLQEGGIVMRPITAHIAEKAPEAVIPLDRFDMIGGRKVNIFVELDGRVIAKAIGEPLVEEIRLKTGGHI